MDAQTLRCLFLEHAQVHGHVIIDGAPLIPERDPSVLFTTAGMHPLAPFLLGEPHPAGARLTNAQKCLRTNDILEVGDETHLTFFEMLGNWSLGDYWKHEAIQISYAFLTERLGLEPERLYATCFAGDADAPRDDEAADVWRELGFPEQRIVFLPKHDNWWGPVGETGLCGPDSEMFYDTNPDGPAGETPATNPARFWEVGNNVFLQYNKLADGRYVLLERKNIDLGMGLERMLAVVQGVSSPYETELFRPIVEATLALAREPQPFALRVIADHLRAAMFVLAEGVQPGNVGQPYIVRRLIRRAVRYGREIGIAGQFLARLAETAIPSLSNAYPELEQQRERICTALDDEERQFQRTLTQGERAFAKVVAAHQRAGTNVLPGDAVFRLYETYGFPAELTEELATQRGLSVDMDGFHTAFREHQRRSREGAEGRFRGGMKR
jgi:alanyl-tRNA synthetase